MPDDDDVKRFLDPSPLIGDEGPTPAEPVDLLDDYPTCGHCGGTTRSFHPTEWRPGLLAEGELRRLPVVFQCYDCDNYALMVYEIEGDADGRAAIKRRRAFPTPIVGATAAKRYRGTLIDECRREAWDSYFARHFRGAIVLARTTLQVMGRRYLDPSTWGTFGNEMAALGAVAGDGWKAISVGIKDLGNEWAHPDPSDPERPTSSRARAMLERMDKVLLFTAEMENVGHLTPINLDPSERATDDA